MDSLRSLNNSLPAASPAKNQSGEPPEELLQAFKAAALSVTKLYKTAAADQGRARSEGYQDALDELLAYLDKEDIGLTDGEGWRIRRWATERLNGRDSVPVDSDDEAGEKNERSSSPVLQRSHSTTQVPSVPTRLARTESPIRTESAPPIPSQQSTNDLLMNIIPPQGAFTFRSSHTYPQDADMGLSELDISDRSQSQDSASHTAAPLGVSAARQSRNSRHNNLPARNSRAPSTIGRAAGQKRKINFGEFFDLGNLGHKDAFGGGGKRGRFA